jgi:ribose transport system permease protein
MAIGMAMVIITGQIDLSLGSSLVLCTGVTIMTYNATGGNVLLMLIAAVASGLLCGLLNGVMVAYAKMPAFIATLGTQLIYRSLTLSVVRKIDPALTGSSSSQFSMISDMPSYDFLRMQFGTGSLRIGSIMIPYISFLFVAITLFFIFLMSNTKYGKSIYAVGSNEKTARLTGINVEGVKLSVFVVTGLLVGISSFIQACKIGNVTPASSGISYEMYAIVALVLGGVNMAGGKGKILGVFFGALSYTTINFIIVSIPALSPDIQDTFQGLVLIAVIFIQTAGPVIKEKFQSMRKHAKTT